MISKELWDRINKCCTEYEPCAPVFKELTSIILKKEDKEDIKQDYGVLLKEISVNLIYPHRKKVELKIYKEYFTFGDLKVKIDQISNLFLLDTPEKTKPHWSLMIQEEDFIGIGMDVKVKEDIINTLLTVGEIRKIGIEKITEKEYVQAYLKNKDGYLYFLENGIFYGFKKPVLYFCKQDIVSMNVLCITGRTFNLNVNLKDKSWEFSMIDQREYDKICKFMEKLEIKGNDLQEIKENAETNIQEMEFLEDEEDDEDFRLSQSDSQSDSQDSDDSQDAQDSQDSEGESFSQGSGQESEEESELQVSEEKVSLAVEQENISDENESRRKKRKSIPKKLSGMQATADAVRKQLETRVGSVSILKKKASIKKKEAEIISIESDVDELDD